MQVGVASDEAVANQYVFVIDPCEVSRAALQFMLQDEYETHEWRALGEALGRMRERRPELVIVGAGALEPDGSQAMDRIREASPATRILVRVGAPNGPEDRRWLAWGAQGLLPQPLTVEAVRRKARLALGRSAPLGIGVEAG